MRILLLILLWPILEIAVFVAVSDETGFWTALLLWAIGAVFGGLLIQIKGLHTGFVLQDALERGEIPLDTMFSGICVFFAGVLLILPGFLSSILGLFLLIPPIRVVLRNIVAKRLDRKGQAGQGGHRHAPHSPYARGDAIDVDYVEVDSVEITQDQIGGKED